MPMYKTGSVPDCPHCGKMLEGPIEDHVVQGTYGQRNKPYPGDCGWCDRLFQVTKLDDDNYELTAKPGMR